MFYHLSMPAEVELHPRHFGPTMRQTLEDKLTKEVSTVEFAAKPKGPSGCRCCICAAAAAA